MSERITVYAGEPMALALVGHDDNRSGRLNSICARYLALVARDSPTWTRAQWCAVCDALNGAWMSEEVGIGFSWAEIADADRLNGLGEKWGVDAQALAAEIRALPFCAKVALIEIVERFWVHAGLETDAALHAAGAKIAGKK